MHAPWICSAIAVASLACTTTALAEAAKTGEPAPSAIAVVAGRSATTMHSGLPGADLTATIARWLASEFGMPAMRQAPRFTLVSSKRLASLRLRGIEGDHWMGVSATAAQQAEVVAVYDIEARTIYLADTWTGATPADLSVVVHEMAHHLQNESGMKFACAEEREAFAFAAQERWLSASGTNLETEFGLDPFTLLVRTTCHY